MTKVAKRAARTGMLGMFLGSNNRTTWVWVYYRKNSRYLTFVIKNVVFILDTLTKKNPPIMSRTTITANMLWYNNTIKELCRKMVGILTGAGFVGVNIQTPNNYRSTKPTSVNVFYGDMLKSVSERQGPVAIERLKKAFRLMGVQVKSEEPESFKLVISMLLPLSRAAAISPRSFPEYEAAQPITIPDFDSGEYERGNWDEEESLHESGLNKEELSEKLTDDFLAEGDNSRVVRQALSSYIMGVLGYDGISVHPERTDKPNHTKYASVIFDGDRIEGRKIFDELKPKLKDVGFKVGELDRTKVRLQVRLNAKMGFLYDHCRELFELAKTWSPSVREPSSPPMSAKEEPAVREPAKPAETKSRQETAAPTLVQVAEQGPGVKGRQVDQGVVAGEPEHRAFRSRQALTLELKSALEKLGAEHVAMTPGGYDNKTYGTCFQLKADDCVSVMQALVLQGFVFRVEVSTKGKTDGFPKLLLHPGHFSGLDCDFSDPEDVAEWYEEYLEALTTLFGVENPKLPFVTEEPESTEEPDMSQAEAVEETPVPPSIAEVQQNGHYGKTEEVAGDPPVETPPSPSAFEIEEDLKEMGHREPEPPPAEAGPSPDQSLEQILGKINELGSQMEKQRGPGAELLAPYIAKKLAEEFSVLDVTKLEPIILRALKRHMD